MAPPEQIPPPLVSGTLTRRSPANSERLVEEEVVLVTDNPDGVSVSRTSTYKLLHYRDLPEWLQDNDCLLTGHRPHLPSYHLCFRSVFKIHSETGNIWTHLIGAIIFLGLAFELYFFSGSDLPLLDKAMFGVYFLSAFACFTFSWTYHTLDCHSASVMAACKRFDYAGIAVMITGSFIPWLHYAFYCQPVAKTIYMVVFPITGLSVAAVTLWPIMGTPAYRGLRSAIFVVFGLSSIVPYIHWSLVQDSNPIEISLIKSAMVGVFYIGGAALYANRIPERLIPGKVDYWFQSHQIFHVCVVIAALIHYNNLHEIAHCRSYGSYLCLADVADVET